MSILIYIRYLSCFSSCFPCPPLDPNPSPKKAESLGAFSAQDTEPPEPKKAESSKPKEDPKPAGASAKKILSCQAIPKHCDCLVLPFVVRRH